MIRYHPTTKVFALILIAAGSFVGMYSLLQIGFTSRLDSIVKAAPCWFLTPRVEEILVEDLVMWTEHTAHNPEATMQEWYDLRVPEVVAMNNSMGVTVVEVTACFDTLHPEE